MITLKDEILNENLIERTADKIIETANLKANTKTERLANMRKELAEIELQLENFMKFIADGFESVTVREKIKELEIKKAAIEKSLLVAHATTTRTIERDILIEQIKNDTDRLIQSPDNNRELIRKYITKIIISDETVEVTALSDIVSNGSSGRGI